jgi:hypothetical protein
VVLFSVGRSGDLQLGTGLLGWVSSGCHRFARSQPLLLFFFFFLFKGFMGLFVLDLCQGTCGFIVTINLLFSIFCFFFFLVSQNTVKFFLKFFPKCNQTPEKKLISLKSFTFETILRWKIIYNKTNGALIASPVSIHSSTIETEGSHSCPSAGYDETRSS